jgi:VCBS repeat protein
MKTRHLVALIVLVYVTLFVSHPALAQFSQQGPKLVGTGAVGNARQGYSVSLSADGNTAIVGGFFDNSTAGAAWVWTKSGGIWTQQGAKLVGAGAVFNAFQGWSVSLAADGNTAIVGGIGDNGSDGAAWVWTRSGGTWTQQGIKLVGAGAVGGANQGHSVSLSADGNTAIVGGMGDNSSAGAAWVWTRSGGIWTQQGAKLFGSGAVGSANQGFSVSLAADGNTAIVGGRGDNGGAGAAWVWTRSAGIWTQQGTKLFGSGAMGFGRQGSSVSLSADGNTAIVGGFLDNNGGAAWVWTRSVGIWTQQGAKLVGSDAVGLARQGNSVSLSADGNTAIVGGYLDDGAGAAWVWTRSGGVWTQQGAKLVGSGAVGNANQGYSVSLSANGNTAIVGGLADDSNAGAAWVFTSPASVAKADFDGDGRSDRTTFRPDSGAWYSALSGGGATATTWGVSTDVDVAGDYDGDGKADIAVWRPSNGTWYIIQSGDSAVRLVVWGVSGDIPLAGDVDGDGKADQVIYRPSAGAWYFNKSGGGTGFLGWGTSSDQPLLVDFDGDGKADPTVFRPSNGFWYGVVSAGGTKIVGWGTTGDIPVAGDFDGDGKSDVTVFRPGTGQWFVLNSSNGSATVVSWGVSGDIPVSGDWDGDGRSDFTVWRPAGAATWYTQYAIGGVAVVGWGTTGDRPSGRRPGN